MKSTGASTLDTRIHREWDILAAAATVVDDGVETIDGTVGHGTVMSSASGGEDSEALKVDVFEGEEFDVQNALDSEEEVFDFLAEALEGECFDPNLVV